MQDFRGLYQGPFIVQTLGEHFSSIDGARDVPNLFDENDRPRGALALSIAAVCNHICIKKILIMHLG
jgi:hypothetical protein